MTDNNSVLLEKRGQAFWITINRPDKRNAINGDVVAGIAKGYRDAHDDHGCARHRPDRRRRQGILRRRRPAEQRRGVRDGFCQAECRLRRSAAAVAERHQTGDRAGRRRLHGRRHGPVVHDRHGGGGRSRDLRIARGEGRRVPDAGAEPAAIDRAAAPHQRMGADRRAVRCADRAGRRASELCGACRPNSTPRSTG